MENKKTLNRIIIFFSALIIITFSVFYKDLTSIIVSNKWFSFLYFITIYLSIACTGVGLVISIACGFKDEYDIIWFVQFLNLCAFLIVSITSLVFAINLSTTITTAYFFFCLEYFFLNSTNMVFQTIKNFKFFKKDMKSVFTNGEPDKSYRYGLENSEKEELDTKKLKSEKYNLVQDEENEFEKEENDENLTTNTLIKEEDITNNENTIESINQDAIASDNELIFKNEYKNDELNSENISFKNENNEKFSNDAKDLSGTITFAEDEIQEDENQKRINEVQEDVERIIKESKRKRNNKKTSIQEGKTETTTISNEEVFFDPNVKNEVEENISDNNEIVAPILKQPTSEIKDIDEASLPNDEYANLEETAPDNVLEAQNKNLEIEKKEKKMEAKQKEKETKATKLSFLNKFIKK